MISTGLELRNILVSGSLGQGSTRAGSKSDLRNMLIVEYWHFSNGDAMAPARCRRFRSEVPVMTISAWRHFFASRTIVVRFVLSRGAWCRCRSSCGLYKSSSWILGDMVDLPGSALSASAISGSVSLSSWLVISIVRTFGFS